MTVDVIWEEGGRKTHKIYLIWHCRRLKIYSVLVQNYYVRRSYLVKIIFQLRFTASRRYLFSSVLRSRRFSLCSCTLVCSKFRTSFGVATPKMIASPRYMCDVNMGWGCIFALGARSLLEFFPSRITTWGTQKSDKLSKVRVTDKAKYAESHVMAPSPHRASITNHTTFISKL